MRLTLDPTSPTGVSVVPESQTVVRNGPGYVSNKITGLITAGTNVTITGSGTEPSPYQISASGGGGGAVDSVNGQTGVVSVALNDLTGYADTAPESQGVDTVLYFQGYDGDGKLIASFLPQAVRSVNGVGGDVVFGLNDLDTSGFVLSNIPDVNNATPSDGDAFIWDGTNGYWRPLALNQDLIPDGTTYKQYSATEKTKLAGIATAATANDTDANLKARANHTGSQLASTISDFNTAADARITAATGSTLATLSGGKIPTSQIPAIGLVTVQTAASQAAQLALTTQEGDIVVRSDEHKTYMRNSGSTGTMTDFTLLDTPTDAVTSVNGQTGTVVLAKGDVGLGNVDNTSDANKPVSTAQATSIATKEPTITAGTSAQYYRGDKTMQALDQDAVPSGTTNKVYTATEKTKLAAITGTNTGDQTISDATISTTDITTNNASTSKHGFLKKLSNVSTEYMDGSGAWSTPAGIGDMVLASAQTNTGAKTFNAGTLIDKGTQVFNVKAYGAVGNGSTDDTAAIALAIAAANVAGGTVFFPAGNYKVTSASRTDTVSFSSGSTFNDTSAIVGDVGKYVLWGNLGRVAKITSVVAGVSFTVDVAPLTTAATSARIITPGIVLPEGVYLRGVGANYNTQLTSSGAIGNVCTQITDAGTGTTILIRGGNSPAGGSTRYGISNLSVIGSSSTKYGLFVGNGAWLIDSDNAEFSNHGTAGIGLDGNINSHNFHNTILYANGSATATTATGGVVTHPFNAAGSASCNFYNTFFTANIGFGICDGVDTGGAYGVNLWAPQFNSQQVSLMANSGTSAVLQSKGTGDGMATWIGGWSESAALYDVITSGYVTIIGVRMHSTHAYHWIVNGGVANAIGCTFEGASTATAQLNSSGIFNWNGIKVTTDPVLYSGAPSTIPPSGSSGTFFGSTINANAVTNFGDFTNKDAATATKALRFQTSGASLDLAAAGSTIYVSNWTNPDFTGTQKFYMAFDTAGNFDAFQVWRFHSVPFAATTVTIDPGSGTPLAIVGDATVSAAGSGSTSVVTNGATQTLTGKTISGSANTLSNIANASLTNSSVTIGSTAVSLGATAATLAGLTLTAPVINNPTFTGFGGLASRTADTSAINTTETLLTSITIPTAAVGTTYRITLHGTMTASVANLSTFTLRAGTAGTTSDASIATGTVTSAAAGTGVPFRVVIEYTLRTNGATGNGQGVMEIVNNGTTGISTTATNVAALTTSGSFNTTSATKLDITYKSAATTTTATFQNAIIEIVKP